MKDEPMRYRAMVLTLCVQDAGKRQNLGRNYHEVVRRLDGLGIMINGSFVFGFDGD